MPLDPRAGAAAQRRRLPDRRGADAAVLPQREAAGVGRRDSRAARGIAQGRRLLVADGAVRARPAGAARRRRLRRRRLGEVDVVRGRARAGRCRWSIAARASGCWRSSGRRRQRSAAGVFVTRAEADLFGRLAPECSSARARDRERRRHATTSRRVPSVRRRMPPRRGADRVHRGDGLLAEHRRRHLVRARGAAARARPCGRTSRFYIVGMNPAPAVSRAGGRIPASW